MTMTGVVGGAVGRMTGAVTVVTMIGAREPPPAMELVAEPSLEPLLLVAAACPPAAEAEEGAGIMSITTTVGAACACAVAMEGAMVVAELSGNPEMPENAEKPAGWETKASMITVVVLAKDWELAMVMKLVAAAVVGAGTETGSPAAWVMLTTMTPGAPLAAGGSAVMRTVWVVVGEMAPPTPGVMTTGPAAELLVAEGGTMTALAELMPGIGEVIEGTTTATLLEKTGGATGVAEGMTAGMEGAAEVTKGAVRVALEGAGRGAMLVELGKTPAAEELPPAIGPPVPVTMGPVGVGTGGDTGGSVPGGAGGADTGGADAGGADDGGADAGGADSGGADAGGAEAGGADAGGADTGGAVAGGPAAESVSARTSAGARLMG